MYTRSPKDSFLRFMQNAYADTNLTLAEIVVLVLCAILGIYYVFV